MATDIAAVFEQYSIVLYKYALRLSQDMFVAQDVTAEVFAKMMAIGCMPRTNLRAYLFQAAYHQYLNYYRAIRRLAPLELYSPLEDPTESPALKLERQEFVVERATRFAWLVSVIKANLTPTQRHVIMLRLMEGYTPAETARTLGLSYQRVKTTQKRGLVRLGKVLGIEIALPRRKRWN
jgi:RNA polymerase sigma factor, sigma-70 family